MKWHWIGGAAMTALALRRVTSSWLEIWSPDLDRRLLVPAVRRSDRAQVARVERLLRERR